MRFDLRRMSQQLAYIILFSIFIRTISLFYFPFSYGTQKAFLSWLLVFLFAFVLKFSLDYLNAKNKKSSLVMCLILMITIAFLGLYYFSLPKEEYRYVEDGIAYFVYPHYEKNQDGEKVLAFYSFYYQDTVIDEYFYPHPVMIKKSKDLRSHFDFDDPKLERIYTEDFAFLKTKGVLEDLASNPKEMVKDAKFRFSFQGREMALVLVNRAMGSEQYQVFAQKEDGNWESLGFLEETSELMDIFLTKETVFLSHAPSKQTPIISITKNFQEYSLLQFDQIVDNHLYLQRVEENKVILGSAPWDKKISESIYLLEENKAKFLRKERLD